MSGDQWYVWIQPADRSADDVMSASGRSLERSDSAAREDLIAVVDRVSRRRKSKLPTGGYVARGRQETLGQLPLMPRGSAHVVVAVHNETWPLDRVDVLVDDVIAAAERAGYPADRGHVKAGVQAVLRAARPGCLIGVLR